MEHTAKIVSVSAVADGILAVRVRCCGDKSTDSVLSLHQLGRDDAAIDKDIQDHLAKVQQAHSDRDRAKVHIERLLKK
jgi:hypothetical protein